MSEEEKECGCYLKTYYICRYAEDDGSELCSYYKKKDGLDVCKYLQCGGECENKSACIEAINKYYD